MAYKPTDTTIINGSTNSPDGNAVYDYVGVGGPFLPLSGGTLTGSLIGTSLSASSLTLYSTLIVPSVTLTSDPNYNTKFGYNSLASQGAGWGYFNAAFGYNSLSANVSGTENCAFGYNTLRSSISAANNTVFGSYGLQANTTGRLNVGVGSNVLYSNISGEYNTSIGANSSYVNTSGNNNICIGTNSGKYNTGSNKLYINSIDRVNTSNEDARSIIIGTQNTTVSLQTLTLNAATTVSNTLTATQFRLSALNTAPSSATDTGTLGEIRIASGFIYICVATNTWQRVAIATW